MNTSESKPRALQSSACLYDSLTDYYQGRFGWMGMWAKRGSGVMNGKVAGVAAVLRKRAN